MKNIVQKSIFNEKYGDHKGDYSELLVDLMVQQHQGLSWYPRAISDTAFTGFYGRLGISPRATVLDVGCGVGASIVPFARSGARVLGIDFSATGIRRARALFRAAGMRQVSFEKADFFALHKRRTRFDIISLQTFMEHMEDMAQAEKALRAARTLLKKGGRVYIFTVNSSFIFRTLARIFYPGYLRRQLEAMGHHDQLFYGAADFKRIFRTTGFSAADIRYVFGPVTFLYDLYVYPRLLSAVLAGRPGLLRYRSMQRAYDMLLLPLLRVLALIDVPFLWAGNSSGIVAIAVKS